ncbi:hypothetical protein [Streptomyces sp. NRRL F-5123]|uniref:hypothetical protein n=1 Tax=Streptomyces sp. NRRL F-5123 TaxID=1463856 RepID=UPI0004E27ABC|nr:hypothetical protein [Streptomyces sp. NRRL F-5123]
MPDAGSTGPAPTATTLPAPAAARGGSASDAAREPRVFRVLPLGVGMVLVGLGLGFLGLRLRRG